MPGVLLKLVKDKLLYRGKVRHLSPLRRGKRSHTKREVDLQLKPRERETQLQWMSTNHHKKLAAETPKDRDALHQMRGRLAAKTPEETGYSG